MLHKLATILNCSIHHSELWLDQLVCMQTVILIIWADFNPRYINGNSVPVVVTYLLNLCLGLPPLTVSNSNASNHHLLSLRGNTYSQAVFFLIICEGTVLFPPPIVLMYPLTLVVFLLI